MPSFTTLSHVILAFAGTSYTQSTLIANPQHSGVPNIYPNPYRYPHGNSTSWIATHNQSWFNSSGPNSLWSDATDSNGNYLAANYPGRAPAVPLAVRSPYTSAWASTANNASLNSQFPIFWDGSSLGWEGIVTVDGVSYEWMGVGSRSLPQLANFVSAFPISIAYDSSYSNYTFAAGPLELTASFFSPVTPTDYCRQSIPLSYLSVSVISKDGNPHDVSLYTDINGAWVTQPAAPLMWEMLQNSNAVNGSNVTINDVSSLYTWIIQLQDQYEFGENYGQSVPEAGQGVFPQWGNFTWTSSQGSAQSIRFQSGYSVNQRFKYVMGQSLDNVVDQDFRSYDESDPVFAFQHDLGQIDNGTAAGPVVYTLGQVVTPAIRLLSSFGIESLEPWWNTSSCYGDLSSMINFHYHDLSEVQQLAARFETKLKQDINIYFGNPDNKTAIQGSQYSPMFYNGTNGNVTGTDQFGDQYIFNSENAYGWLEVPGDGCVLDGLAVPDSSEEESYYAFTALAARQVLAAIVLTNQSRATSTTDTEPLAFLKEISSSGNVNTVDVIFPAIPFFLWSNPDLLRYLLEPLFINQEAHFYPNSYAMHDLGSHFPNATGHVEGNDEYMPVEESGNMIIMAYAVYKFTGSASYLQNHYTILKQWAQYLIEYSLVPAIQLSTDDFAGQLANQSNLAIKGIVGLAAMAEISNAVGDAVLANNYSMTANEYYGNWTEYAIDPTGKHTLLGYQWRSSWGLLYNTYPSKLLNLSIIPESLFKMQSDYYPSVSQVWGIPLDSRHDWTKSDWEMWTAATCEPATRRLFVDSLAYWLNTTSSPYPFSDLFQTIAEGESPSNPNAIDFLARPVQGGLFSFLALVAAGTYA